MVVKSPTTGKFLFICTRHGKNDVVSSQVDTWIEADTMLREHNNRKH
jgi:hypothetical protein